MRFNFKKRIGLVGAVFLCATIFGQHAQAGPFGIDMGAAIESLDAENDGNKTSLNSVPSPHPLFKGYSVWHSPKTGVCRIVAIGYLSENDAYGENVRQSFSRVETAINSKYGQGKHISFLKPGALWDEARYWVMSLRNNERTYASVWEDVSADDENYQMIQLWVKGVSSDTSFVVLEYRSPDFQDCVSEIESSQDSSF